MASIYESNEPMSATVNAEDVGMLEVAADSLDVGSLL